MNELEKKIHAILFWKNEPMTLKELAKITSTKEENITSALINIRQALEQTGVTLIKNEDEYRLATDRSVSDTIENLQRNELSKELSKATLETLSIILYKGPVKRSDIDYIRGVNSQFTIRHLEIRGLIEKKNHPEDARVFLYQPTSDLLAFLGIKNKEELDGFEDLNKKIENYQKNIEETLEENNSNNS